jgi:hypothetical protein
MNFTELKSAENSSNSSFFRQLTSWAEVDFWVRRDKLN